MNAFLPLLLVIGTLAAPVAPQGGPGSQDGAVAFEGVHVLPMDGERVLRDHTVLVRGDRIAAVGPVDEVAVPDGALRVDARGRYLMPGLAEMHGHVPPPGADAAYVEAVLLLYVANGITTVRGMQGHPGQLALRRRANTGELLAPTLYLAGPPFSGGTIDSPAQAAQRARAQHAEGWDLLKVLPGLSVDEYDAMARAANDVGIDFAGHVPSEVGLVRVLAAGQRTIDHLDGYIEYLDGDRGPVSQERLDEVVRRSREAGVWVVPTMALWETLVGTADLETLTGYDELRYMPPEMVAGWTRAHERRLAAADFDAEAARHRIDNRMRLLGALSDGGVPILLGTDAPQQFSVPGFSLHRELPRMVDAGMTPYEILRSGTQNVGRYFSDRDAFGTVAPGQRADLILLESNPLEDVAHVADRAGVMVRGRWLSEADIQARLEQIDHQRH